MDRFYIDLVDLRNMKDGHYSWVIQIKDHFSHYAWLHPLRTKESKRVAKVMADWFMYTGYPKILQCDNGGEFNGALLELCEKVKVKVVNGAPYKPSTWCSVEENVTCFVAQDIGLLRIPFQVCFSTEDSRIAVRISEERFPESTPYTPPMDALRGCIRIGTSTLFSSGPWATILRTYLPTYREMIITVFD